MTERRIKRKFDNNEVDNTVSLDILDILSEGFPSIYSSLHMCQYLRANPIPTDINVYNKCKNNPGDLIKDFYVYLDGIIKMFVNDLYFIVISGEYLCFADFTYNRNGIIKANVVEEIGNTGFIFLAPKILEEMFPILSSGSHYGTGINSIQESKPFLIFTMNKVFYNFCLDFNNKYNSKIVISVEDDDVITISFDFSNI